MIPSGKLSCWQSNPEFGRLPALLDRGEREKVGAVGRLYVLLCKEEGVGLLLFRGSVADPYEDLSSRVKYVDVVHA